MTQSAPQQRSRIVVGVDGSPSSLDALRWAVGQARATGAVVDAIATWQQPALVYGPGYYVPPVADSDLDQGVAKVLNDSVAQALDGGVGVEIDQRVVEGHPAQALLEAARGAALLVLGNRGHGGFAGALLGSVGQHCVQHAPCPVVIVRHDS
ncbi:universal stress protein [Streptacidiphilus anmyonensis]|uniref:universal stress protein n=1 Tax=Streptacidiphilus anmyonensis TaxID=405782 RepID=UPI0005A7D2CB|nr:universal stress protein [Streptacidiphilus anmyonensis]